MGGISFSRGPRRWSFRRVLGLGFGKTICWALSVESPGVSVDALTSSPPDSWVPISYAIGQSAPLIAASWGIFVWREFSRRAAPSLTAILWMFLMYIAAISLIALAYEG